MIVLNNKKFAETEDEMIESLFDRTGTCIGYARRNKHSIVLQDIQKNRVGVINQDGCLCCATKTEDGYWYSYANISLLGKYSYGQMKEDIENLTLKRTGLKRFYK